MHEIMGLLKSGVPGEGEFYEQRKGAAMGVPGL